MMATRCTAIVLDFPVPSRHPLLVALEPVAEALGADLVPPSRLARGDIPLEWEGELVGGLRLPGVHGTLDRMIGAVEAELGAPLAELSREDKQRAVHMLDQRGAFQPPQVGGGAGRRPRGQPLHRLQLPERGWEVRAWR